MPFFTLFRLGLPLISALTLLAACGQDKQESFTDKVRQAAEDSAFTGPALWRVADEDTTIYLFGTVHTLHADTKWETRFVLDALQDADAIYFEADVETPAAQRDINDIVTQQGLFIDGQTLEDVLPADAEREVEEALALLGVSMQGIYNFKPWLASMQLSSIHLESRNFRSDLGVERVISVDARQRGIPIRYLETGAYQMGLLASVPQTEQIAMLVQTAQQIEDEPDALDRLIVNWSQGDVAALAKTISKDDVFGSGEVYNLMLRTRNANWSDKIKTLLDEEAGTFFIAVGAAHLAGDDSVQNLLAANGISSERENPQTAP